MSSELQLVIDIWAAVRDVVPTAKRADAAVGIMTALADYGFGCNELIDCCDEDHDLSDAFRSVFEDDLDEDLEVDEDD